VVGTSLLHFLLYSELNATLIMPDDFITPSLNFFSRTPANLLDTPPLVNSLQTLESSFISIRFNRFPDALISCVTAWESALKAALKVPQDQVIYLEDLIASARAVNPALQNFSDEFLRECRRTRNRIIHYGYSPKDGDECARQLLRTGIPFLERIYIAFFDFHLTWQSLSPKPASVGECGEERLAHVGLSPYIGDFLELTRTYFRNTVQHTKGIRPSLAFLPFSHLLARNFADPITWVEEFAIHTAEERGILFEQQRDMAKEWELKLDREDRYYQWFSCPICDEPSGFISVYNTAAYYKDEFRFTHGKCMRCGFGVPVEAPGLIELLLKPVLRGEPSPRQWPDFGY
jgi:hypothetical protein